MTKKQRIIELRREGLKPEFIAERLGTSLRYVARIREGAVGTVKEQRQRKTMKKAWSRDYAGQLREEGKTYQEIGRLCGVNTTTVWKHFNKK